MICPNCGRETSGKFCPICGTRLAAESAPPQANNQGSSPRWNSAPNQTPAPNQPYNSGFAYNQNRNPGYVPQQGYNPGQQVVGGYQGMPAGAIGQTPASQMIRKVASSPLFLVAALLFTLNFLFAAYVNIRNIVAYLDLLDYYKGSEVKGQIISNVVSAFVTVLLYLLMLISLWSIFGTAASKSRDRMSTGGLTFFKVIYWIALVVAVLILCLFVVLMVMLIASEKYSDFFQDAVIQIRETLSSLGYQLHSWNVSLRTYLYIFLGTLLAVMLLTVFYVAKLIKSLNTAKRVIKTGIPDDRVSVYVGVVTILGALFNVYNGIRWFVDGGSTLEILMGVSLIVSAGSAICFAIVLFRFRSAMRSLGVRKGIMQYNQN